MNSCIICNCGNEVAKYRELYEKAKQEGKQEELFDKLGLKICCRKELTAYTHFIDYFKRAHN